MPAIMEVIRDAYKWITRTVDPVDEPEMNELQRWLSEQADESRRQAARRQHFLERELNPYIRRGSGDGSRT